MPTTIHSFSQEEIMAYLDGDLSPQRALVAAIHLDHCRECQQLAGDFKQVSQSLSNWQVDSSTSELPQVPVKPALKPKLVLWRSPRFLVLSSAAVMVLLVILLFSRSENDYDQRAKNYGERIGQMARLQSSQASSGSMRLERVEPAFRAQTGGVIGGVMSQSPAPPPPPSAPSPGMAQSGPLIVRTAQLSLVSKDFSHNQADVGSIAAEFQGYVAQLDLTTPSGAARTLSATLRVPAARLDAALRRLRDLGHVESESQRGDDVTQQYVDVTARLSNLQTTETRLLRMLREHDGKLGDVLQVEEAVDRARGEIEVTTADQKALSNQIALASIQLAISEEFKASLNWNRSSFLTRMRNAALQGYERLLDLVFGAIEALVSYGPAALLVLAVLFFPARWTWKQWRVRLAMPGS